MPPRRDPAEAFKPNLYVVARFLDELAALGREMSRNQLQMAVGVNYDIFRRYLDLLERKGHLVVDERGVRLTAQGRRVREELRLWIARFLEGAAPARDLRDVRSDEPASAPP